jgi:hypothetical protein
VQQALTLNGQVFSAAMPAVVKTLEGVGSHGAPAPSVMDDLTRQLMQAMIAKMLNPADPIENFTKMATAMGALGFKMGGNPSGGIAVELGRALISALPQLTAHVGGIMDQYARAEEAKLKHAAIVRGNHVITSAPQPQPAPPAPEPKTNVIEMPQAEPAAPPAAAAQADQTEQLFQLVETKVRDLVLDTSLTPQEAANDALTFMDVMDKNLVDELLRHGEAGLRWAFTNRPILMQVPQGPRLDAFIVEFVAKGKKVSMPIPAVPNPEIPPA